jgi:excisionase family DNA binding protein
MSELLTTKDLQSILQVDRTTIYRMADAGRLPGLKVGNQWRFQREKIEAWLQGQQSGPAALQLRHSGDIAGVGGLFPLECVQLMQDTFADALGVMIQVIDLEGQPITQPSNPGGLVAAVLASSWARQRCLDLWMSMAQGPALAPRFVESPLGLLCARGLIRVGSEIKAILVMGSLAPQDWPPHEQKVEAIARDLGISRQLIDQHIDEVHRLPAAGEAGILPFVQRIADVFAHIAAERLQLRDRLQQIAEISRL